MTAKRQMRNPEAWIGKRVEHLNYDRFEMDYGKCDDCQKFFKSDDLLALLYPQSEADWLLQETLHVEEAQGFCPDCLGRIEDEADEIDPDWRKRRDA